MDQPTAERIAAALESIAADLRELVSEPKFVPTGMLVVDKNSPEAIRARLGGQLRTPGGGPLG